MAFGFTPFDLVYQLYGVGDPQISPDGTRAVWVQSHADEDRLKPESQLWIYDVDDYRTRQLTTGARQHGSPRWSPNGDDIAFTSVRDGKHGIYTIRPSGGEAVLQTTHPTPPGELAWAPHGIQLAFTAPFDPDNPDGHRPTPSWHRRSELSTGSTTSRRTAASSTMFATPSGRSRSTPATCNG